jgi:hypothetical protein
MRPKWSLQPVQEGLVCNKSKGPGHGKRGLKGFLAVAIEGML